MARAEVDLDPDAVRAVADHLGAVAPAVQELGGPLETATAAAAHFGAPDHSAALGAELAGRCNDVLSALTRIKQQATTLAEELRTGADRLAGADEHSARIIRAAEDQGG